MELGNTKNLIALDVDSSDNLTDDALHKFLSRYGHQLWGIALSGMPHITDQLWQSVVPVINNAKWVAVILLKQRPQNAFTILVLYLTWSILTA